MIAERGRRFLWTEGDVTFDGPDVVKFDPSEPRDDHGRWTVGQSVATWNKRVEANEGRRSSVAAFAHHWNLTPKTYRAWLDHTAARLTDPATTELRVRLPRYALDDILRDGRFRSQFEEETVQHGVSAKPARWRAENEMFGYSDSTPPDRRPIYGYLADKTNYAENSDALAQFGPVLVRLKDSARENATWTMGDSWYTAEGHAGFGTFGKPSGVALDVDATHERDPLRYVIGTVAPDGTVTPPATPLAQAVTRDHGFVEVQFHGGVSVDDVAEVVFRTAPSAALQAQMADKAIPWRVDPLNIVKYSDSQPRVPAGSPEGGEFASSGAGYHAGDLAYGHDTVLGRMTQGRASGHFGTGVYFVSHPGQITGRTERPVQRVDISGRHLFRPADKQSAWALHEGLRAVDDAVYFLIEDRRYLDAVNKATDNVARATGASVSRVGSVVEDAIASAKTDLPAADRTPAPFFDSAGTRVMKALGYEGVDVRHIPALDNTGYGSVVYAASLPAVKFDTSEPRDAHGRWTTGGGIPPEPGTAPLEPGMVRGYHYTNSVDSLHSILATGLSTAYARGHTYEEPDQLWFSATKPNGDTKAFVEVHVKPEEMNVGGPWAGEKWNQQQVDDFMARGSNFTILATELPPDRIVTYSEPWHDHYRYIMANYPPEKATADTMAEMESVGNYDPDYRQAVDLWLTHVKAEKYSDDQPRVPAGSPEGGEWTAGSLAVTVGGLPSDHSGMFDGSVHLQQGLIDSPSEGYRVSTFAHEVGHAVESMFEDRLSDADFTAGLGHYDPDQARFIVNSPYPYAVRSPSEAAADAVASYAVGGRYVGDMPVMAPAALSWVEARLTEHPAAADLVQQLRSKPDPRDWVDAKKYDPSQPRDERGRWSAEGGGEGPEGVPAGHEAAWRRVLSDLNHDFPTYPGGTGNCYEAAFTLMMARDELGLKNVRVIQATCKGQGAIAGRLFGHSWIEADGETVEGLGDGTRSMTMRNAYDFSSRKETVLPVSVYRYFGQARDIHEYEPLEAMKQVVKHEHYGPWEPTGDDVL